MSINSVGKNIACIRGKVVAVFGDLMLDEYIIGNVDRISPEAPVPIVDIMSREYRLGGAANVAANIKALGSTPILLSVIGSDSAAGKIRELLTSCDISSRILCENRPTTIKTRIVAHNQQLVRMDEEIKTPISQDTELKMIELSSEVIPECDIILISDYAKGAITERVIRHIIELSQKTGKPIIADPKRLFDFYKGVKLITPNELELNRLSGLKINEEQKIKNLIHALDFDALLVTRGEKGMVLFTRNEKYIIPAICSHEEVADVTGAGDTVLAVIGLGIAGGFDISESVNLANVAAGLKVRKFGTVPIRYEELENEIMGK